MADHQLPAYLQNSAVPDFTDYASDGIGSMLPPHVSIQGNMFTLIDATGQEFQPMPTMDVVIVDRSTVTCKMYFGKPWTPGSEEPPMCWSTNGIGPSRDAVSPQARTCGECPHNIRGSAQSAISGAATKACRDEYHLAILVPTIPNMLFRYVLTPGSFKNWAAYTEQFKNSNVRISFVLTRMSFKPKVNGEVEFKSVAYVDEATNGIVQKALIEKATDALVGRLDTPRVAALPAPVAQQQIEQPASRVQPPFTPAPAALLTPTGGPAAVIQQPVPGGQPEPAPTQRRRRRTAAEMAEANGAPTNGQTPVQPAAAPQAPFPHPPTQAASAGQAPAPQGNFGMAPGQPAAANPELNTMLDDFFKQA